MKTPSLKSTEVSRQWYVIDASKMPLGRISTLAAKYLVGKHKPTYTPHIDNGDYVIVINASKIVVTGRKLDQKTYYSHSGYMGGLKQVDLKTLLAENPTKVIKHSIKGMLPKNKLQSGRINRLKIYAGETHEHEAQKPVVLDATEKGNK